MNLKTVLVVDDSTSFRTVVKLALVKAGYDVAEAGNGLEAGQRLKAPGKISLVICDVNMPGMDGIAFLHAIKADPVHKFTPVIMLTNETQAQISAEARAAGARAWITKPFQPARLVEAVHKLCV